MPIRIKSLYGLILCIFFHISVYSQSNFVAFNTIPKSGTALINTHMDDDLIWMLPFWNITEKFISGAMPSTPDYETLIQQQQVFLNNNGYNINYESNWITPWGVINQEEYEQYYWANFPSLSYISDDHLISKWNDVDNILVRKEINRIKAKLEQYIASPDLSRIVTHNNWGEYGHQQHKALNVAVRELAVKYRKDVWISDWYLDVNVPSGIPSAIKYTLTSFNTPELFTGIRSIYEANGCWTYDPDLVPSGDHKFIKIVEGGIDKSDILTGETVTTSGPSQDAPGAYIFDGVDDYMTLPGNNRPSFTIAMWVRPDQIKRMDISKMAEYPSSTIFDRSFYMQSDGRVTAHVFNGGSKSVTSTGTINSGEWTNVLMSGDGNSMKLYLNGVLAGSVITGSTFTFFSSPEFVLGQAQETSNFFKGQIKDVQFFDYMLSDGEIASLIAEPPPETFTITADAGNGGSINPSGNGVLPEGFSKIYKIAPDIGYIISDVKVDNISVGAVSSYTFTNVISNHSITASFTQYTMPNIALNKPSTSSSNESGRGPSFANDADGTNNSYWSANPYPQWWQVDLGTLYDLSGIIIRNFVDGIRYYQYTIEGSVDGVTYFPVAVKSNTKLAKDFGDSYPLSSTARYLRVKMSYNSANSGVHITDFRVFGTESGKINLIISGLTANNKVYDGTTAAVMNTGSATLVGVLVGDLITLVKTGATGSFANKNAGTDKTVTTSGFTLSGPDAWKYVLTQPTTTANISAQPITVTADTKLKVVGDPDPTLTFQITSGNLVGTDVFAGGLLRVPGEEAGSYAILQNTLANSNYAITYIGANLTISVITGIKPINNGEFGLKVYPNPFTDHLNFDLQWNRNAKACIEIFNMNGVKIATIFSDDIEGDQVYRLEYTPYNIRTGILFYRLVIDGKLIFTDKLIHISNTIWQ